MAAKSNNNASNEYFRFNGYTGLSNEEIVQFMYTGTEEDIPRNVTHLYVNAVSVPEGIFGDHPNIVGIIFSDKVKKAHDWAFRNTPSLRRAVMPGVEELEQHAFDNSAALTDVECERLEIIQHCVFQNCCSLRNINLQLVREVYGGAFAECTAMTEAIFGTKLLVIEEYAFARCENLERIAIPLKNSLFPDDNTFMGCVKLNHVELVGDKLHETIAALQLEEWRNDINEEIDDINQILPTVSAGGWDDYGNEDEGGKARAIRTWMRTILDKINRYKADHRRVLEDAAASLKLVLPPHIAIDFVLPFLELPQDPQ